jgi:hypothetical protein
MAAPQTIRHTNNRSGQWLAAVRGKKYYADRLTLHLHRDLYWKLNLALVGTVSMNCARY